MVAMRHPRIIAFERRLKELFDELDAHLEQRFGDSHNLHPARPARGTTANPEQDGLFNVGASFSAGYGSEVGRGYVIEVRMVTLDAIAPKERDAIIDVAVAKIAQLLPRYFSDRALRVSRDGDLFKIHGNLSFDVL